jgi:short-subunit dehydrogenase
MAARLKPVAEQVILITGASSGIGLVTAKSAAARGAKVMLVARSEEALRKAVDEITQAGGTADFAVADVASIEQLRQAADKAVAKFGRIDTWVNNAGVGMFGNIVDEPIKDDKRLFETNFWGLVHGSRLAVEHLKGNGGAIINLGSVVSDRAVPLQGMYSASKHAVMGFTDALRMEIEESGAPIQVTLIKPSAIDTPYIKHAPNHMKEEPNFPPPVYAPDLVARQILYAAENRVRDLYVGGGGHILGSLGKVMPRLMDWIMEATMFKQQKLDQPAKRRRGSLHATGGDHTVRGDSPQRGRMVRKYSAHDLLSRHPFLLLAAVSTAAALGAYAISHTPTPPPTLRRRAREFAEGLPDRARHWAEEIPDQARRLVSHLPKHPIQYVAEHLLHR